MLPDHTKLCIHPRYEQRAEPRHFDDRRMRDEWQNDVYLYAARIARGGAQRILDFGCGSGYKFMKYFGGYDTVGFELEPSLSYLKETYPDRQWYSPDSVSCFVGDLLICSDVIEHIVDPLPLMEKIKRGPLQRVILSTPALEVLSERGQSPRLGPPNNESHVREWTTLEFQSFVEMHLRILDHVVFARQGTQLIYAELRR